MTVDPHLSRPEWLVALLLHFGQLSLLSWRLTRFSADLSYRWILVLCLLGQVILIFGFASDRLVYLIAAALCYLWISWVFIGYVAEVERTDRIKLSLLNPIFALLGVYSVYLATM